jgi:hypothetical protein
MIRARAIERLPLYQCLSQNAFKRWKHLAAKKKTPNDAHCNQVLEEVQVDMREAHRLLRTMRALLAITKLTKFMESKVKLNLSLTLGILKCSP